MWCAPTAQTINASDVATDDLAGTLLITIHAIPEEWDEFLPVAEEILSGISFPDL